MASRDLYVTFRVWSYSVRVWTTAGLCSQRVFTLGRAVLCPACRALPPSLPCMSCLAVDRAQWRATRLLPSSRPPCSRLPGVVLLLLLLMMRPVKVAAKCRRTEVAALWSLYELTGGAYWHQNKNWHPDGDPCDNTARWVGVGVTDNCRRWYDGEDCYMGRITALYNETHTSQWVLKHLEQIC